MVSRTYHIYPALPSIYSTNSYLSDEKMRSFLQSKGISFPPGSDLQYDQSTQLLQVRNTLFNQRLLCHVLIQANMVEVLVKIEIVVLEVSGISVGYLTKRNSNFGEYLDAMRDKYRMKRYTMITRFQVPILFTQIEGKEPKQHDAFKMVNMSSTDEIARHVFNFQNGDFGFRAHCLPFLPATGFQPSIVNLSLICAIRLPGEKGLPIENKLVTMCSLKEGELTLLSCSPHTGDGKVYSNESTSWIYIAVKTDIIVGEENRRASGVGPSQW